MCGISGYYDADSSYDREQLELMTNALFHRGPDAGGYFTDNKTGLGHRRLSILDLSAASNQPFYSQSKRYVIVFNGEVYNYREIAVKYRLNLHTTSDTEVIVELFEKIGVEAVK